MGRSDREAEREGGEGDNDDGDNELVFAYDVDSVCVEGLAGEGDGSDKEGVDGERPGRDDQVLDVAVVLNTPVPDRRTAKARGLISERVRPMSGTSCSHRYACVNKIEDEETEDKVLVQSPILPLKVLIVLERLRGGHTRQETSQDCRYIIVS